MKKQRGRPRIPKEVKKKQLRFWLTQECIDKIYETGGPVCTAREIERIVLGR